MSKIISDPQILDRVKKAKAGDIAVYINYEAIKELPEEFDVQISKIDFDIKKDFSDVGNSTYMPTTAMQYRIAEAKGISGIGNPLVSPIYENVNINEMYRKDDYKQMNMLVGYRCTKQSTVLNEDGTSRLSSPCTIDYNVWNRCVEAWSKEEMYTDGYKKTGKYPPKYDTQYKRKAHFHSEMKFAMQKAESKAFIKTIRELAGLMTGYTAEELKEGSWYFAKIRRSADIMKMETAARLTALENGTADPERAARKLFGSSEPEQKQIEQKDVTPEPVQQAESESEPVKDISDEEIIVRSKPQEMSEALKKYLADDEIKKNISDSEQLAGLIKWLDSNPDIESGSGVTYWKKAVAKLKEIEKGIPEFMQEKHELY